MKRLDLIIDALESCKETSWSMTFDAESVQEALAAARSLRELELVGVCVEATIYSQNEVDWYSYTPDAGTELYALGEAND